jgi:3-hydroxyethyl bacteriochlorophyllide a dehydrogenase
MMLMMKTQAVVIPEAGRVEFQEVTLRTPGPEDVIVRTAYTSISAGTERMLLAGQMPHPMLRLPVIPGYETVGQIVDVGASVTDHQPGEWVYVGGAQCYDGINAAWGGQSTLLFAPAGRVVPLKGIEPRYGVLLALAATSLHGVDVLNPKPGERVLVLGQGPVGQLASRIAGGRGAWVASADRSASRLTRSVGAEVINTEQMPLNQAIREPVQAIIEATGSMPALTSALSLLAPGGTILLLGYYDALQVPYMPLFLKEARLLTAKEWGPGDLLRCRDLIANGSLAVASLLTHEVAISELSAAYDTALNNPECLKLILNWT